MNKCIIIILSPMLPIEQNEYILKLSIDSFPYVLKFYFCRQLENLEHRVSRDIYTILSLLEGGADRPQPQPSQPYPTRSVSQPSEIAQVGFGTRCFDVDSNQSEISKHL